MEDEEFDQPEPQPGERRLNIQMPAELIGQLDKMAQELAVKPLLKR